MIEWKTTDEIPNKGNSIFIVIPHYKDNNKNMIQTGIFLDCNYLNPPTHWWIDPGNGDDHDSVMISDIMGWIYEHELHKLLLISYEKQKEEELNDF